MRCILCLLWSFSAAAAGAATAAQLRVSSPYLDVVARYRSGDYLKAVDEMRGFPPVGVRERARRDLIDLTCLVLCGTADCARARQQKPAEFERVREVWASALPAAAALHMDTAAANQIAGRTEAAEVHRRLALEILDWPGEGVDPLPEGAPAAARSPLDRTVRLLSIWLLQLRFELDALDEPLARLQQHFPKDPLVLLAVGSLHEMRARPHALLEAGAGRQGNVAEWRRQERQFRLSSAADAYAAALAADAALAEAHLRVGRVLMLQGDADGAEAALGRVREATIDRRWRYLAALFRAALDEERGRMEAAAAHYGEALELWPASQAAPLALGRMAAAQGRWDEAQAKLGVFAPPGPSDQRPEDPWWAYDFGQAWRIESGLSELRRMVVP